MSEAQQTFNALSRKIELLRAQLAAWETAITQFRHKYAQELLPLFEQSLALQLAVEQIDQVALVNIGESRLAHYNQVLAEQLGELIREIRHVETEFLRQFGIQSSTGLAPGKLLRLLTKDVVAMQQLVFQYKKDLLACASSDKLKAWLKLFRSC